MSPSQDGVPAAPDARPLTAGRPLSWSPDAVIEVHDDGAVVVDSRTFGYVDLDRVGAAMWAAVASTGDLDAAVDLLLERFAVERDVLDRDLTAFVARLAEQGLVSDTGADEPPARSAPGPEDLYLDLLERVLVGFLPGAPRAERLGTRIQGKGDDRSPGLTLIGMPRMHHLRLLTERVLAEEVPGDLVECGVWRGGAVVMMRAVLAARGVRDRTVWAADSFAGLPEARLEQDSTWKGAERKLAVPLATVRSNIAAFGLLDDQVRFLPGWFADTLPTAPIERIALLRLDGDYYESTMDTLTALYDTVSPGGFVVVDDWAIESCRAACEDFRTARGITAEVVPIDWCGAFWQVPTAPS